MSNFEKAHNRYLDPQDQPEAEFCEECGEEMQQKQENKMYKDKLLRYVIPAQKKFAKVYKTHELGLVAITSGYVHVTGYKFKNILDQFSDEGLNYVSRKFNKNDFHLEMVVDGVVFVTVGTRKELKKAGLTP